MIKCFKCGDIFKSPTDDDAFRGLFSSSGSPGVKQAENIGSAYCARKAGWVKAGWVDEADIVWACPGCVQKAKNTTPPLGGARS